MDLEEWVLELLDNIKLAGVDHESFDLHLSENDVKEIAQAYENLEFLEIY